MNRQDAEVAYIPSKYSKAFNNYSRSQIKSIIPILRSVARSCNIAFRYPIYKVLKAIAKIFLMNQIEAIFFAYMIKETNWDIKDKLITQNSQHVRDVVSFMSDQPQYKNLILYLMLVTYSLKFFLNENSQQLLEEAVRICPGFKHIFENWAKKHSSLTKRINPKTLNKVYQDLYIKIRHEQPDFNLLIDCTLQISPAYNPQKSQKDRRVKDDKEKKDKKETLPRQNPTKIVKVQQQQDLYLQHNPIFSSSRLYQMAGVGLNISEGSNFQVFGQMQKSINVGTRFGNSVFGSSALIGMLNSNYSVKDQGYCEQLNLGLQEGQSEQNINFRQVANDPPPTSIINLSRANSITERYLSFKTEGSDYRGLM